MSKKIWQKNPIKNSSLVEKVEKFTVGNDKIFDAFLAKADVIGSLAHTQMLYEVGLLSTEDWRAIEKELHHILKEIETGQFVYDPNAEDIHSHIEAVLTERIGEAGKKIHSGRSRNDQILLDLKLYFADSLKEITDRVQQLFDLLMELSFRHKQDLLPGYTHFQQAMPSSFGLWFGAYAESLSDDTEFLQSIYQLIHRNPLGSAAGYGSSFPLDRKRTTEILGMSDLHYNVVYAQMTRGKTEKWMAMILSQFASTLSKLAYDACLYMNQQFAFIKFPDELTTGSSIMPHKKNPDVFELIRARCSRIISVPNELALLTHHLPSGYHRDFQLTKDCLFPAIESLKDCIEMMTLMMQHIEIRKNILDDTNFNTLFSVEEVNRLTLEGIPFRDAYKIIGQRIEKNEFIPDKNIEHTHLGSMGKLCLEEIKNRFYSTLHKVKYKQAL
ncbi:MAG TPA: argininosuccinate lyase [Saprospiraceae bacterium]|nr:argininosuccinate lyase [Saprospiraceae bacterium]